jgi:hypothetical protein
VWCKELTDGIEVRNWQEERWCKELPGGRVAQGSDRTKDGVRN